MFAVAEIPLVVETQAQFDALVAIALQRGRSSTGIKTFATQLGIGDWTTMDGQVVPADKYPATVSISVVTSPGALTDRPRRRIPEEVKIDASNRWAAGHGWDGAVWRPVSAQRGDYMDLVVGNYDTSSGELTGSAPELIPDGTYLVYDAWDNTWVTFPVMRFTSTDVMSTRSQRWATQKGAGALGVFIVNDVNDGTPAWILGFTTPDPMDTFGLGVTVSNGGRVSLQLTDSNGTSELTWVDMRSDMDYPTMIGFFYSAAKREASLLVRGPHVRTVVSARLDQINGQPAGQAIASLDFALMYSQAEDEACVLDVCMWTYDVPVKELNDALNAYTELYGIGTTARDKS